MWPFKRKQLDISLLPPLGNEDATWGVAQAVYDNEPLIVRFNSSADEWRGHSALPVKLGFACPLNSPNAGGLPDPDENEQLNAVEDAIIAEVASRTPGVHALTLTTGIMKEFIFYIPEGVDIRAMHQTLQANVTSHDVQCIAEMEPKWATYKQFSA